jgi:cytochrome c biogenesis protein CcmG/thiol:disulfide interchange protein DsbE
MLGLVVVAGCGDEEPSASDTAERKQAEYEQELRDAPPPLAEIVAQQNELLGGGSEAFERRLDELRGYPVVVNKWASWCGPCRHEFPFFQHQAAERGEEIAFLGVDSEDNDDAARTFLSQFPVPYPSYLDPDGDLADALGAEIEFPATIFIDADGEVAYVRRGGYASEEDLAADIDRYAR